MYTPILENHVNGCHGNNTFFLSATDACSHTGIVTVTTNICLFVHLLDLLVNVSLTNHGHVRTLLPFHGTSRTHDLMYSRLTVENFGDLG